MIDNNLPNHHTFDDIQVDVRFQHQSSSNRQLAPRNAPPVTRHPHRATRNPQPTTSIHFRASGIQLLAIAMVFFLLGSFAFNVSAATSDSAADAFTADIQKLSSLGDRSTGSGGNAAAAAYIRDRFTALGIETVDLHKFDVATIIPKSSSLTLADRGLSIPIRPMRANAVTPQTIPAPGIKAHLVYVGHGDFHELNGKAIEGSIVMMELESGKNWQYAADLGAKALIYVGRGNASNLFFEEKFELSPIQFPRFWMPLDQVQELFHDFEFRPAGHLADAVTLVSDINWETVVAENVYAIIPGSDPDLSEQSILIEAFYDSTAWVAGLSPGADEACGVATLLYLAQYLKDYPPRRTVVLAATSGHAQSLAGMRELFWSFTTRSLIQRKMGRELKALVKKTRRTIDALENISFESSSTEDPAVEERRVLAKNALEEQVKTVSDVVSRRLMRLRLQENSAADQAEIEKLSRERSLLRRLVWMPAYTDLLPEERQALNRLIPQTIVEQSAILKDAETQQTLLDSARDLRGQVNIYDLVATVSLHLSSHGDGFGAFNYGWQYPFRERINRTAAYSLLDEILRRGAVDVEKSLGIEGS
jgi:hypothetical protein